MSDALVIRRATTADEAAVLELLGTSLGWVPDAEHAAFYRWKHVDNAFGPSPVWIAEEEGRLAGVRILMRWRWRRPDGSEAEAVRAVDTATHPDFRGRGIFTRLTLAAVDELTEEGVQFVFNTPNEQSRPGYVKMGWEVLGRVPVAVRPRTPSSLVTIARSRTAADKWGRPTEAFDDPADALADDSHVEALLAADDRRRGRRAGLRTARSAAQLRWRYGFAPLGYRVASAPGGLEDGAIVFRLRRRGPSLEATVADALAPPGGGRTLGRLLGTVLAETGADYAIAVAGDRMADLSRGLVPIPRLGPVLTQRGLADPTITPLGGWDLVLGDVELF